MEIDTHIIESTQADHVNIAHISDLHFTSTTRHTDPHLESLCQAIADPGSVTNLDGVDRIDILAITGDVSDSSIRDILAVPQLSTRARLAMYQLGNATGLSGLTDRLRESLERAKEFIEEMAGCASIRDDGCVCVVPGNHDARLKGFLPTTLGRQRDLLDQFREVFGDWYSDRSIEFCDDGMPWMQICVGCLNSNDVNPYTSFATGNVSASELNRISGIFSGDHASHAFKLALLHHHPMPIALSETGSITDAESTMMLKNAGSVMQEFARARINLALHGHKHIPAISKVQFPRDSYHELAVVAAGNAGPQCSRTSFNIVQVSRDHSIRVVELRRGPSGSFSVAQDSDVTSREASRLHTAMRIGHANGKPFARTRNRVVRLDIEDNGDAEVRSEYLGLSGSPRSPCESIPWMVRTRSGYGAVQPEVDVSTSPDRSWKWVEDEDALNNDNGASDDGSVTPLAVRGQIEFSPPIGYEDSADLRFKDTYHNLFHHIREFKSYLTPTVKHEHFSSKIITESENLTMIVNQCSYLSFVEQGYWIEVFDQDGHLAPAETKHSAQCSTIINNGRTLVWVVRKPIPGYRYCVCWNLLKKAEFDDIAYAPISGKDAADLEHLTSFLLDDSSDKKVCEILRAWKRSMHGGFEGGGAVASFDDDVSVSLMVFDSEEAALRLVGHTDGAANRKSAKRWRFGEGLVGQAMRRRETMFFQRHTSAGYSSTCYKKDGTNREHSFLICIPIVFPPNARSPVESRRILGILNISSYADNSGLGIFFDKDDVNERLRKALVDCVIGEYPESLMSAITTESSV